MHKIIIKGFIALMLTLSTLAAQQLVDGIAAVVGKEIVLKSEIQQYVQNYAIQNRININQNPDMVKKLSIQTLEKLIEQKLLLAKADEDTLRVDDTMLDQKVEERLRYMVEQVGSEEKLEEAFGNPIKKIKKDTRKSIEEQMLVEQARATQFRAMKISRREVESFYATYKDSLPALQETVDISHILMLIKPSDEAREKAYQAIADINEKLAQGSDFAELAQKYSDDPASARRGGDLGLIGRGDFVPEFESAAYKLQDGEVSGIVETQFGFHIIQMIERRGEKIRTRHILIRLIPTDEDEQRVVQQLIDIRQQILDGAAFDAMALKYSDDENVVKDQGNIGVFETEQMVIPQFKAQVQPLSPGEVSEPFKTDFGYHIVKLNDRQSARRLSLEDDWERVEQVALNYKMENHYIEWIKELKTIVPVEVREIF